MNSSLSTRFASWPSVCWLVVGLLLVPRALAAHPGSGIVVDRAGTVYFVRLGSDVIWKLDADGRVEKFIEDPRIRLPHHLMWGPEGAIYFASDHDGQVWRVRPGGSPELFRRSARIIGFPRALIGAGGDPFAVAPDGSIYALDGPAGAALIRVQGDSGHRVAADRSFEPLHGGGMTFGADGVLYLTDGLRVWRIRGDSAESFVPGEGALDQGAGIAVGADGMIYVADFGGRKVIALDSTGRVVTPSALAGLDLEWPTGVAVGVDGAIYVLDNREDDLAIWRVRGEVADRLLRERTWRGVAIRWGPVGVVGVLVFLVILQRIQRRRAA